MDVVIVAFAAVALVAFFMVALPIGIEYIFHPAERQRRRHKGKEWSYGDAYLPCASTSEGDVFELETRIKYSAKRGEYFYQTRSSQWTKGWKKIESKDLIEKVKTQL